jgi:hypothetical protein
MTCGWAARIGDSGFLAVRWIANPCQTARRISNRSYEQLCKLLFHGVVIPASAVLAKVAQNRGFVRFFGLFPTPLICFALSIRRMTLSGIFGKYEAFRSDGQRLLHNEGRARIGPELAKLGHLGHRRNARCFSWTSRKVATAFPGTVCIGWRSFFGPPRCRPRSRSLAFIFLFFVYARARVPTNIFLSAVCAQPRLSQRPGNWRRCPAPRSRALWSHSRGTEPNFQRTGWRGDSPPSVARPRLRAYPKTGLDPPQSGVIAGFSDRFLGERPAKT